MKGCWTCRLAAGGLVVESAGPGRILREARRRGKCRRGMGAMPLFWHSHRLLYPCLLEAPGIS
jgi:hypothetical protein